MGYYCYSDHAIINGTGGYPWATNSDDEDDNCHSNTHNYLDVCCTHTILDECGNCSGINYVASCTEGQCVGENGMDCAGVCQNGETDYGGNPGTYLDAVWQGYWADEDSDDSGDQYQGWYCSNDPDIDEPVNTPGHWYTTHSDNDGGSCSCSYNNDDDCYDDFQETD